jgi:multiple sugar transport system permease protein
MSDLRRGRSVYAALAYVPVVIPPVVAVLLWRFFYDSSPTGVFNTIVGWIGRGPIPGWTSTAARSFARSGTSPSLSCAGCCSSP